MRINFGELHIGESSKARINDCIERNWVTEGIYTKAFENKFARLFGYKYAIATGSGTDACIACLSTLYDWGAKRGDEVIVPADTFVATANAILAAGFIPKFVDIDVNTLNIDTEKIEDAITWKTAAIMPVHLMGKPAEMDTICQIAKNNELKVIEDCCESHGAKYKGKFVGTIGDMGAFSFYVAHVVVCGEGGMVVTNDEHTANLIRSIKSHGRPPGSIYFDFQRFGLNLRINDLMAAIGIEGLDSFWDNFNKRKENIKKLLELTNSIDYFSTTKEEPYECISPHAFPIILKDKKYDVNKLNSFLESNSIQCKTLFGSLPTQHNAFKFLNHHLGDFPNAEYIGDNGTHFGIHQYLSDEDITYIADTLKRYTW